MILRLDGHDRYRSASRVPLETGRQPVELQPRTHVAGDRTEHPRAHAGLQAARQLEDRDVHSPRPLGDLPEHYKRMLDPFVALAFASAATTSLLLGTGVCLVAQRDPIITAKQVATLDRLSGGRFLFGVGAGWNVEEMENHGTDSTTHFALMRERVLAMKEIWTRDEASYHGELVDFDPIWSWPEPVAKPHPPILIGGSGPKAIDRVLDYGDGWNAGMQPPDVLVDRCAELRRRAAGAGRGELPVTATADFEPATIEALRDAGVSRVLTYLEPCGRDEAEARLDRLAALAAAARR